ncbi:hypothetical protein ACHAXA_011795 [Cyclostephanos tholiformis]|uniref:Uncharacterized protein n=1 Tax=Cyclostephanos tholiformis TaxID=382380 RepID=A0ABD3R2F1_9STRA
MGCGSSSPQQAVPPPGGGGATPPAPGGGGQSGQGGAYPANNANASRARGSDIAANNGVDAELERARAEDEGKIKMLLLGAGESGKSTIFKQMRLLYNSAERTDDDLRMYGVVARSNIVVAVRKLCAHLRNLGLEEELDRESRDAEGESGGGGHSGMSVRQAYDELMAYLVDNTANAAGGMDVKCGTVGTTSQDPSFSIKYPPLDDDLNTGKKDWVGQSPRAGLAANNDAKLFLAHHESIRILWQVNIHFFYGWGLLPCVRFALLESCWFCITMSHENIGIGDDGDSMWDGYLIIGEYLDDVSRIASPDYKPTVQDVLIARVRTTQVVMEKYRIDGIDFEVYDVGGQRSERRKWIDCFDSVTAVIFVAALSEYDQYLAEAKRTNRMVEALELFRSVCNNRAFSNTSIMLFLNKKDIFTEKIMYSDIAAQRPFCDYAGPTKDFDHGVLYFIQKFKDCLIDDEFNDSFIHNLKRSGFLGAD